MASTLNLRRLLPWLLAAVLLVALIAALAWHATGPHAHGNTHTVGEAVDGIANGSRDQGSSSGGQSGAANSNGEASAVPPNYRIKELAAALGIPESSMPQTAWSLDPRREQTRGYLSSLLRTAVEAGNITSADAETILKAFDLGFVDAPASPVLAGGTN